MLYSSQNTYVSPDTFRTKAAAGDIHYLSEQSAHPSNVVFYTMKTKSSDWNLGVAGSLSHA